MSRHSYSDSLDEWAMGRWRGAVASAIRGKRGQRLLRELAAALDAMSVKSLIEGSLEFEGEVCALGALGMARGIDMSHVDPNDAEQVADTFGCSKALAREIMYENDEQWQVTPEQRWQAMRRWVERQIA